jgi:hypothetical protein
LSSNFSIRGTHSDATEKGKELLIRLPPSPFNIDDKPLKLGSRSNGNIGGAGGSTAETPVIRWIASHILVRRARAGRKRHGRGRSNIHLFKSVRDCRASERARIKGGSRWSGIRGGFDGSRDNYRSVIFYQVSKGKLTSSLYR